MGHFRPAKTLLIMAGGLGSRYKGLKQVDGITPNGETVLEFSIYDALMAGFTKIVVVVNSHLPKSYLTRLEKIAVEKQFELHLAEQSLEKFIPTEFYYLLQDRQKPWGTAHAILCAKECIREPFVVINADDYYGKQAFVNMAACIDNGQIQHQQFAMVAFPVSATLSENGAVSRGICTLTDDGSLQKVIERTKIAREGKDIVFIENGKKEIIESDTLVSMNFWGFHPAIFENLEKAFYAFLESVPDPTSELYIPTEVQRMIDSKSVKVSVLDTTDCWHGITYPEDKVQLVDFISECVTNKLYPSELWK
ncbi:nucleotidyltransferase family protein [Flavobacterium ammonificans]|uniref:nucleotidyltransferase family protein n=1 Tax=Flavobacterium ammonificans TaxID=1751056 RepID=UPI001E4DF1E8|nr:sugar phosphate nucleotidyltransferase [Flavobacterium ammonificans]BDB56684.1 nucleotidyltransferase [Flavobacterium ammonificans]